MARSTTIAIVASALWLASSVAHAAGLGKLTVLSPLGQPLLAEVEIVALQPGEEDGLSARLASPDAYNAAGIEISSVLLGVRVDIARRNNRPVLRLTTKQPVNEPFLDMLVELQWPTGRLVREYTFLLDPPDYRNRPTIAAAPALRQPEVALEAQPVVPAPQPEVQAPQPEAQAPQPEPQAPQPELQAQPEPQPQTAAPSEQAPTSPEPVASGAKPAAEEEKPAEEATPIEQQPIPSLEAATQEPTKPEAAKEEPSAQAAQPTTYQVKKGDTLGDIARANLQPGVTLNQMLIAIFRANQDAFIRGNMNLVRTGKILNIPTGQDLDTLDSGEANRLVQEHNQQFAQYRSRLAAVPSAVEGGPEREASGPIEPKAEPPAPAAPADQVRLSKSEPGKPGAPASQAAGQDDAAAQQRALEEAQSRTAELEKNVADLQKLLELKNQQLAELEKKASAKPAPAVPQAAAPQPSAPQPPTAAAEKPAVALAGQATAPSAPPAQAMAPSQSAAPATPAAVEPPAQAAPSHAQAPQPAPAAKPAAPKPAVKPKPRPAPPPEPSLVDEFLDNPLYLAGLGLVVLLLAAYAAFSWRRKKAAHAKFQDSVMGAAAAGGGVAALHESTAPAASVSQAPVSQAPAGMEPEEVDPIAEADVYMAYGRDAQAEEILREALQKDSSRAAVHAKLLEIYANRKDAKAFEQTALKLKNLTSGSGPEWEKAAALGRAIDPQNSVYGDVAAAPVAVPAAAAAAPVLDFDLGGGSQGGPAAPDISLDEPVKDATASNVDFELGATNTLKLDQQSPDSTVAVPVAGHPETGGLDFNLDLGGPEEKPAAEAQPAEEPSGLDFNLDLGEAKSDAVGSTPQPGAAPALDLGDISLDLGTPAAETAVATAVSADPKWQEVATKLDLAKAYEEMGDKDGARELLNEVMKDGDTAQKGQAQQILAKLA